MIESTSGPIQPNSLKSANSRQKVDPDKKSEQGSSESLSLDADQLQINPTKIQRKDDRPVQTPIAHQEEAETLAKDLSSQILQFPGLADSAQANLNPDKVLELIA